MAHPITSKRKAQAISTAFFLLGLASLIFTDLADYGSLYRYCPPLTILTGKK